MNTNRGLTTKVGQRPTCHTCERWLRPIHDGQYACPCCGEIFVLIERIVGNPGPDGHGFVALGMAARKGAGTSALPVQHLCDGPSRRRRIHEQQGAFDLGAGDE